MSLNDATLSERLALLRNEVKSLRSGLADSRTKMAAGNVSANAVLQIATRLQLSKVGLQGYVGDAAFLAFARQQFAAPALDLDARIADITDAMDAVVALIVSAFPTASQGGTAYILKDTLNADGSVSVRVFTPAQTAPLRTAIQDLEDELGA